MKWFYRLIDKIRCPISGMTLEQQDVTRNALWAARGILLHSRNAGELSDQDYILVCKRFDKVDEILQKREVNTMKKLLLVLLCLGLMGCATDINKITDNYAESSAAVKAFAQVTADDWLFGSGIIQGALPEDAVPAWVFAELRKVDGWFEAGEPLTETQLGYMVGVRLRLAGPIIESAIKVYAPGIMGIAQVTTVLAFLGL